MPTCCVCQGYYDSDKRIDPATRERLEPDQCVRCKRSNTRWEEARHGGFGDLWNRMPVSALMALTPIVAELILLLYMVARALWDEQFRKSELILAMFFTLLSLVFARLCFSWRFRAREDTLLRSIAIGRRLSVFRIVSFSPVLIVPLAMIWVVLAWFASLLPADQVSRFPWNGITAPGVTILLVYTLLTSLTPTVMLSIARRYADSFDLPLPIFLNVPLMRKVVIDEYLAKLGDDTPRRGLEYRELKRTPQGGLSVTIMWKVEEKGDKGEKTIKVTLESDPWARLLSAKEEADKS
jgi:hypothetical protein